MTLKEPLGVYGDKTFTSKGILEHLNVTKDQSDYLWYLTRIYISDDDISFWKQKDVSSTIDIDSMHDFVRIFVYGQLAGIWLGCFSAVLLSICFLFVIALPNSPGIVRVYLRH
ncbi:Beta-galactosidase 9 [Capsicum chinense]|nr:Beta-galactosidase 9 [Capsicum chinense]